MTKLLPSLFTVATLLTLCLHAAPAQALNTRSFISANGLDTNACTRTAPCRTLQKAHDSTSANGEINMLDPAGYGTVIITKSISIVNDGVGSAGILVPSAGTGITINAGANDEINLRGLIIEGAGVGQDGIRFNTGGALTIENSVIRNMAGAGIDFPTTTTSSLAVSNSFIARTAGPGAHIRPSGSGLTVKAVFSRVELHNNNNAGIAVDGTAVTGAGTISVVAVDSVASNIFSTGFLVGSAGGASCVLLLLRSVSANNGYGVFAAGPLASLRLAQSAVTGNATGYRVDGGAVLATFGDNYIADNDDNIGLLTPISKQ